MDEGRHELDLILVSERTRAGLRDRLQEVRVGRFPFEKERPEVSHTGRCERLRYSDSRRGRCEDEVADLERQAWRDEHRLRNHASLCFATPCQ